MENRLYHFPGKALKRYTIKKSSFSLPQVETKKHLYARARARVCVCVCVCVCVSVCVSVSIYLYVEALAPTRLNLSPPLSLFLSLSPSCVPNFGVVCESVWTTLHAYTLPTFRSLRILRGEPLARKREVYCPWRAGMLTKRTLDVTTVNSTIEKGKWENISFVLLCHPHTKLKNVDKSVFFLPQTHYVVNLLFS